MNKIKSIFLFKMDSDFHAMNKEPNYDSLKIDQQDVFNYELINFENNFLDMNNELLLVAENLHDIAIKTTEVEKTLSIAADNLNLIQNNDNDDDF